MVARLLNRETRDMRCSTAPGWKGHLQERNVSYVRSRGRVVVTLPDTTKAVGAVVEKGEQNGWPPGVASENDSDADVVGPVYPAPGDLPSGVNDRYSGPVQRLPPFGGRWLSRSSRANSDNSSCPIAVLLPTAETH